MTEIQDFDEVDADWYAKNSPQLCEGNSEPHSIESWQRLDAKARRLFKVERQPLRVDRRPRLVRTPRRSSFRCPPFRRAPRQRARRTRQSRPARAPSGRSADSPDPAPLRKAASSEDRDSTGHKRCEHPHVAERMPRHPSSGGPA